MIHRLLSLLLLWAALAACSPTAPSASQPTAIPFPTATIGHTVFGVLATPDLSGQTIANPATVVAMAARATATPDLSACPAPQDGIILSNRAESTQAVIGAILDFLNDGGAPASLAQNLETQWGLITPERGYAHLGVDFTGEGVAEIVLGLTMPDDSGTLLILGCVEGRYVQHYAFTADDPAPPEVIQLDDINRSGLNNLAFVGVRCEREAIETCRVQTHLIGWQPDLGRFASLLGTAIISDSVPRVVDIDGDNVGEIVVQLESTGTFATGPLRTGVNIYDWDGSAYVLSIAQWDPPRFRIQVIHEGDRNFIRRDMQAAVELYRLALRNDDLRTWHNGETPILRSYALYRTLLALAYTNELTAFNAFEDILREFPDNAASDPIFVEMSRVFWAAYNIDSDINRACADVRRLIEARPDALDLMNRYGSRSPTYTEIDLCPF